MVQSAKPPIFDVIDIEREIEEEFRKLPSTRESQPTDFAAPSVSAPDLSMPDYVEHRAGATEIGEQFRRAAEPPAVCRALADADGAAPAADVEAGDFVDGEPGGIRSLRRDPRMHAEVAAPAHGTRRVDLHDRVARDSRVGSEPDGRTTRLPPIVD